MEKVMKFKVYGRIIGSFSENAEFATREEARVQFDKWIGIMDEVEIVKL